MMHNLEVNVEIGKESKKGGKSEQGAAQTAAANKFLSSARLKESFNLSFDALFLDMFTEVQAPKSERIERPRELERPQAAAPVERPRLESHSGGQERVEFRPVEAHRGDRPSEAKTADPKSERIEAEEDVRDETGAKTLSNENVDESTQGSDDAGKIESVHVQVKMIRVELSAKLQNALTSDQITDLKNQVEKLLKDESAEPHQLLAGVMEIVASLIGPKAAIDAVEAGPEIGGDDVPKFLKRFLKELSHALETTATNQAESEKSMDSPVLEAKIESALSKLVEKMDRKITDADQQMFRDLLKNDAPREAAKAIANEEKPVEILKPLEVKRETTRLQILETRIEEKFQARMTQEAIEASLADLPKIRQKSPVQVVAGAQTGIGGVGDVARTARSGEGQHTPWQNSYNQNSAQKNLGETARTARGQDAARAQAQQAIFDQIVQNAKITVTDGRSEATIRLKPELLGRVEMKITVEDGKVAVRFVAENQSVRAAIIENVNELKRSLTETGLEVKDVQVMLSGEFAGNEQNPERETGENASRRYSGGAGGNEEGDLEFEEVRQIVADGSTVRYVA